MVPLSTALVNKAPLLLGEIQDFIFTSLWCHLCHNLVLYTFLFEYTLCNTYFLEIINCMIFEWFKARGFEGHLPYICPFTNGFIKQVILINIENLLFTTLFSWIPFSKWELKQEDRTLPHSTSARNMSIWQLKLFTALHISANDPPKHGSYWFKGYK